MRYVFAVAALGIGLLLTASPASASPKDVALTSETLEAHEQSLSPSEAQVQVDKIVGRFRTAIEHRFKGPRNPKLDRITNNLQKQFGVVIREYFCLMAEVFTGGLLTREADVEELGRGTPRSNQR